MKDRMGAFRGGTPFIIGTIVFFIVCAIGLRFIRNKDKLFEMGGSKSVDGFSTAPTRAADCNCLPGYIPSNSIKGRILGKQGEFITVGSPTLVRYGTESKWVEKTVDKNFQATNDFFGSDPAPGLHKHVETVPSTSTDYFCRSLSDPEKRRPCY